jgi:hypothetical protein
MNRLVDVVRKYTNSLVNRAQEKASGSVGDRKVSETEVTITAIGYMGTGWDRYTSFTSDEYRYRTDNVYRIFAEKDDDELVADFSVNIEDLTINSSNSQEIKETESRHSKLSAISKSATRIGIRDKEMKQMQNYINKHGLTLTVRMGNNLPSNLLQKAYEAMLEQQNAH